MSYSSLEFIVFLSSFLILYFCLPGRVRYLVLLVAGYVYYAYSGFSYLVYLAASTASTFFAAIWLERISKQAAAMVEQKRAEWDLTAKKAYRLSVQKKKRRILALALFFNFGILAFVKYYNFAAGNLNTVLSALFSIQAALPRFDILLPLGISFFTFQSAGYVIDVYRGKYPADRNILKYALFVSFFPQLVQGPIGRHDQLAHQLYAPHKFSLINLRNGAQLMLWGFFKKLVIADRVMVIANTVFGNYMNYAGIEIFFGALVYGLQLYTDFSGGIDIARGTAQILGIDMARNFERPYFSRSLSEFWRRWHISLGSWVRDYVFYPIALSSASSRMTRGLRRHFSVFISKTVPVCLVSIVMFLIIGIWHGASLKYVLYGLWNGGLIALGILSEPLSAKALKKLRIRSEMFFWRLFQIFRTLIICTLGRYLVRSNGVRSAWAMLKRTFGNPNISALTNGAFFKMGLDKKDLLLSAVCVLLLLVVGILQERGHELREELGRKSILLQGIVTICGIFAVLIFGIYGPGYDKAAFLYGQF